MCPPERGGGTRSRVTARKCKEGEGEREKKRVRESKWKNICGIITFLLACEPAAFSLVHRKSLHQNSATVRRHCTLESIIRNANAVSAAAQYGRRPCFERYDADKTLLQMQHRKKKKYCSTMEPKFSHSSFFFGCFVATDDEVKIWIKK